MHDRTAPSATQEWKQHWTVVLAAAAGTSIGSIPTYALGVFIDPLQGSFGWSRAGISGAVTIYAATGAIGSIFAGYLLDRIGARRMGIYATIGFCLIFSAASLITSAIWTWWAIWLLLGIMAWGLKPSVWGKAVTSFFTRSRGMAIGVMLCGTGMGSFLLPNLANWLIIHYGWRNAFIGISIVCIVVVLPLLFLFLYDATDKMHPTHKKAMMESLPGWSVAEGVRKRQLYQIAASAFIVSSIVVGLTFHLVPILASQGIARSTAVPLLSIVGILAIIARLVVGRIFDHFQHPAVGALSFWSPLLPVLILLFWPPSFASALLTVITLGICAGGEFDAILYLSSRFFGLRAFGTLFGIVETALLAGVGLGPIIAGRVFDVYGSYHVFLIGALPAALLAGTLAFLLGRFPDHAKDGQTQIS